jgi:alpha-ketoglutarate-dependent taurine dioxygenase
MIQAEPLSAKLGFGAQVAGTAGLLDAVERDPDAIKSLLARHGGLLLWRHHSTETSEEPRARVLQPADMARAMAALSGEGLRRAKSDTSTPTAEGVTGAPSMSVPGVPCVRRLGNVRDKLGVPQALHCRTGYEWHSDGRRALTLLVCALAPEAGGETLFASASGVWERLPPAEQMRAERAVAVYGSQHTGGGPSAFDCERGLRTSADGTRLLRGVSSRGDLWRPWMSSTPLVTGAAREEPMAGCTASRGGSYSEEGCNRQTGKRIASIDTRHFMRFENIKLLLGERCGSGGGGGGGSSSDEGEAEDEAEAIRLEEASRVLLSQWLSYGLRPTSLAALEPHTLLPAPGQRTVFDPTAVYSHVWQVGDAMLWDNDVLIHTATPSSLVVGQRLMWQIIVKRSKKEDSG